MTKKFNPEKRSYIRKQIHALLDRNWIAYCKEAEHQDGTAYWDNFQTPLQGLEDFIRYMTFVLDIRSKGRK